MKKKCIQPVYEVTEEFSREIEEGKYMLYFYSLFQLGA